MSNTFIFSDESGTKRQDRYFLIGFIKVIDPDKYFKSLSMFRDNLFGVSRNERLARIDNLIRRNDMVQLSKLSRSPFKFELKYSKINKHNSNLYRRFIRTLLNIGIEFVVIGIDRCDPNFTDSYGLITSYKRIINQYFQKYTSSKEYCYIVDDFGIKIENTCEPKYLPSYYVRQLSDSSIYLQAVDILTGSVQFALNRDDTSASKKRASRQSVLDVIEEFFDTTIQRNISKTAKKSYLSI